MLFGDIVDELLDKHGLTNSGTAEKSDFTAFQIRLKKVDDFNAGKQHFL